MCSASTSNRSLQELFDSVESLADLILSSAQIRARSPADGRIRGGLGGSVLVASVGAGTMAFLAGRTDRLGVIAPDLSAAACQTRGDGPLSGFLNSTRCCGIHR